MLQWIYRGLSQGRMTTRYPRRDLPAPDGFHGSVEIVSPDAGEDRIADAWGMGSIVVVDRGVAPLAAQARWLRRSIHVRHIDCGSDGSEEWEIQALWNPFYDIQRLGFFLTNSPRHADVLLATGMVTDPMRSPLERTWAVMPEPKALIAVGTDACGGIDRVLPVDVYVPGMPPPPIAIMHGLLLAAGLKRPDEVAA